MSLFQKSVEHKYLSNLDDINLKLAYDKFKKVYGNAERLENIRLSKEEQYQEGFLRDIFVDTLGYTINPDPGYNLTTEYKNQTDAKKADGAILDNGSAIAVIELKSTKTKSLESVKDQAFRYKNNQPNCKYVITSNFEKLWFYIDNSTDQEEFNLFEMDEDQFKLFYLILNKESILTGIPSKMKQESKLQEENITKKLYKDYSEFKHKIYENLVENNPDIDKLTLLKMSQKLIDRLLFIFFAEDKGLIPPNTIPRVVEDYKQLKELDAYQPLYEQFKKYFSYIDKGYSSQRLNISAYNGELFKTDAILDSLIIDDEILLKDTIKLSSYDFDTEVDVNILGHIFEHSLNDIEQLQAEIKGESFDTKTSKRKKDGVYYTPSYITKYIVDNTLGKLCEEKKEELGIDEVEYEKGRKGRKRTTIATLDNKLKEYREWLLHVSICDPACGSGAFLNQALNSLINEHHYIDQLRAKLLEEGLVFTEIENSILENNLYGVDINEEAVEIAKLSLWLRTAKKGRKLSNLNSKLKCGNSLIDDPEVAGDKAFKWEDEFPEVFEKGGFDVVIGNPPYVRAERLSDIRGFLNKQYKVYEPSGDLFSYFYELSFNIMSANALFGFISNAFDKTSSGKKLRSFLKANIKIINYIDFKNVEVFEGATTYPVILIFKNTSQTGGVFNFKKVKNTNYQLDINNSESYNVLVDSLNDNNWNFDSIEKSKLLNKLRSIDSFKSRNIKCYRGIITGLNEAFITNEYSIESQHLKPIYEGKDIKKWYTPHANQKLIYFENKWTNKEYGTNINGKEAELKFKSEFPILYDFLYSFKERAEKRYDKGSYWWELRNCAYYHLFENKKIIFPNLQNSNKFCFDDKGTYINAPAVILPTNSKELTCILNSKLVWMFLQSICVVRSGGYIEVKPQYFEQIPIPDYNEKQKSALLEKADIMLDQNKKLHETKSEFTNWLKSEYEIEKLSRKLDNFQQLDKGTFITELKKKLPKEKKSISPAKLNELTTYYEEYKSKALDIQAIIDNTDKEIDQMVYELYGLTEEEINIVEGAG